jgi:hypothetical protein
LWKGKGHTWWIFFREENQHVPINSRCTRRVVTLAYGDLTGANYWVWLLSHVLADEKFMTIFSMLFGAGILLMTSHIEGFAWRRATCAEVMGAAGGAV